MEKESKTDDSYELKFVKAVYDACSDKGTRAKLRRADNPNTEYECWDFLIRNGIYIEKDYERLPAALIAASIARSKTEENGSSKFPVALAKSYPDGSNSDSACMKMRRICACDSVEELVTVLRPLIGLVESRASGIDYEDLYKFLRKFRYEDSRQSQKARWFTAFYHSDDDAEEGEQP